MIHSHARESINNFYRKKRQMIEIDGTIYLEFTWRNAYDLAFKKFQDWWLYWNIPLFILTTYSTAKSKPTLKLYGVLLVLSHWLIWINAGIYLMLSQSILIYYDGLKWHNTINPIALSIFAYLFLSWVCGFFPELKRKHQEKEFRDTLTYCF